MFKSILVVLLSATLPIVELRGAIPLGIVVYDLPAWLAYLVSVLGTVLPVLLLLWLWPWLLHSLAKRIKPLNTFLDWLFERTRRRFYQRYQRYGDLALIIFVAIPLPVTGVWTGSVAAYLFGIPYWRALGLITLGALVSGLLVLLATLGVILVF